MKLFFIRLWFKYQLNKGKLIKVNDKHRYVGKTTMLVKKAKELNIPIIVGNQRGIDTIKSIDSEVKVLGLAPNYTINIAGRRFEDGVLVDDTLLPAMLPVLDEHHIKIKGGFINE